MKTNTQVSAKTYSNLISSLELLKAANPDNVDELQSRTKHAVAVKNKYIDERKSLTRELDAYKATLMQPEKAAEATIKAAKERIAELTKLHIAELLNQMQTLQGLDYYAALSQLERIAEPLAVITVDDISQVPLDYLTVDMAKVEAAVKSGDIPNGITVTDKWEPK